MCHVLQGAWFLAVEAGPSGRSGRVRGAAVRDIKLKSDIMQKVSSFALPPTF